LAQELRHRSFGRMRSLIGLALVAAAPCPAEVPAAEENGGIDAIGYIEELLGMLTYNGTHPGGKQTALEVFKPELMCYFGIMLDQGCDGLSESEEDRRELWDETCLDPDKEYFDAFKMLSSDEQKVYNELVYSSDAAVSTNSTTYDGLQVYDTLHQLANPQDGESKEVMCILTKLVDDGCLAFDTPRLSQAWEMKFTETPPILVDDSHSSVLMQHKQHVHRHPVTKQHNVQHQNLRAGHNKKHNKKHNKMGARKHGKHHKHSPVHQAMARPHKE